MATGAPMRMNMVPLRMTMTTDILTLSQLLSPSFPVGAFAYSHGLERLNRQSLLILQLLKVLFHNMTQHLLIGF